MVRVSFACTVAVIAAAVAAEGIVRLAMHPSLDYASAFSPGPYCERPDQGFTFNCPGAASVMHVIPKSRIYIPYQLNENGFRGPFRSPPSENSDKPTRIVLVGGQSQSFGAYLPDRDTFAAVAARSACNQVEISLAAFPGMTDAQSWRIYSQSAEAVPVHDTSSFRFTPTPIRHGARNWTRARNSIWTVPYVDVWLDPTGPLVDHTSGPESACYLVRGQSREDIGHGISAKASAD